MSLSSRQVVSFGAGKRAAAALLTAAAGVTRLRNRLFGRKFSTRPPRRVLLLEPFGLGDAISLEPLVRCLLENGCEVTVCAQAAWRPLFPPQVRWVEARVPWNAHAVAQKYRGKAYLSPEFREFLRALREAAEGGVALDVRGDIRSTWLLHLARCEHVLALSHYLGTSLPLSGAVAELVPFTSDVRRWELNLRFASALGFPVPKNPAPPSVRAAFAPASPPTKGRIGFIPVAPWAGKLWPAENWRTLARRVQLERGGTVAALGGPGQETAVREQLGAGWNVIVCNSLGCWAEELRACERVVTLDTGPMHLADALGVPVTALFGQGALPLWAPSGPQSRYLHHQEAADFFQCHPVEANVATGQKFMARITVEEVWAALAAGVSPVQGGGPK